MLKRSGSLLFAFLLTSSVFGEAPAQKRNPAPEPFSFKESFQEDFHNLFEMLSIEYPEFRRRLTPQDVEKALAAVMNSLDSGVAVEKNADGKSSGANRANVENKPGIRLSNGLVCLRLNSIEKKDVQELISLLKTNAKGIILDLRACSSGDGEELARQLSQFLTDKRNSATPHTAILTGPDTRGAAEILAAMLVNARRGIRIGETTAGEPYPRKTVTVSTRKWLVPLPPKGAEEVKYIRLHPQIAIPARPQTPYDKIKNENFAGSGDHCLSRAADLLISLDLLDEKGLKK